MSHFTGDLPKFIRLKSIGFAVRSLGDKYIMVTWGVEGYDVVMGCLYRDCRVDWTSLNHVSSNILIICTISSAFTTALLTLCWK